MSKRLHYIWLAGLAATVACGDSTGPNGQNDLQLRVQLAGTPVNTTGGGTITAIEIEEAFLVLGGLKLETAGVDGTVDWSFEQSVVLPLSLNGAPTIAFDADAPAGTYKELEISIDKLEPGNPDEQGLINAWPRLTDASVLISGTMIRNGQAVPFSFTAALDIDLELDFATPLVVADDETPTLFEMTLDLDQWFVAQGGGLLDPSNGGDRSAIEATITTSIEVLKES